MKINLNKPLFDLEGNAIPDSNMCLLLANNLSVHGRGDALKIWEIAKKLHSRDEFEIDSADLKLLKNFVETAKLPNTDQDLFPPISKAQLILALDEVK